MYWFFKKIKKMDQPLFKLTKWTEKERKPKLTNSEKKGDITIESKGMK